MKLTVKNLGAIKSGEVDFDKNLILFTGPNNTGKSYLTYLIHAIHNCNTFLSPTDNTAYSAIKSSILEAGSIRKAFEPGNTINLIDLIKTHQSTFNKVISNIIKKNLIKIFASNNINPDLKIETKSLDFSGSKHSGTIGFRVGAEGHDVYAIYKDGRTTSQPLRQIEGTKDMIESIEALSASLLDDYLSDRPLFGKSYVFPAERIAINLFARDIVAKKAGSRDEMALRVLSGEDIQEIARSITEEQNSTPKYPLAINDYIAFVNSFEGSDMISDFNHLAQELEKSIMGGEVGVSEFKQLTFLPNGVETSLNLHESSSLVKSLSFLVIYLRHFASKGDWIIIDEPEINLHPNLQVAIARIFAKMINAGLKLILSTHSDYLIKELNTLVLLHDLHERPKHEAFIKSQGYVKAELLNKKQIGAYYLDGGKINLIDVETTGIVVPTIDKTIDKIDNLAEEIYFKLSEPEPVKPVRKKKA